MENTQNTPSLTSLFKDPNTIVEAFKNPSRFAMNTYNSLSTKNKQYVAYAAGIGLIIYGLSLSRKNKPTL